MALRLTDPMRYPNAPAVAPGIPLPPRPQLYEEPAEHDRPEAAPVGNEAEYMAREFIQHIDAVYIEAAVGGGIPPIPHHLDWSPQKILSEGMFNYAEERAYAARYNDLQSPTGLLSHFPGMRGLVRSVQESRPYRTQNRTIRFVREAGVGWGVAAAARTAANAAATGLAGAAHTVGITSGGLGYIAAAAIGGVTGGIMGYRRGGQRYYEGQFQAEHLSEDMNVEGLVDEWRDLASLMHEEVDATEAGGTYTQSNNTRTDFIRRVEERLKELDTLSDERMVQGSYEARLTLARNRSKLAAILETNMYLEEIKSRGRDITDYLPEMATSRTTANPAAPVIVGVPPIPTTPAITPDQQRNLTSVLLATHSGFKESQAYRQEGLDQKVKELISTHKAAARKASRKGALWGAIIGAGGGLAVKGLAAAWHAVHNVNHVQAHVTGATDTLHRDVGFGLHDKQTYTTSEIGNVAMKDAINDDKFNELTNRLIAGHLQGNHFDLPAINQILHDRGLPSFEHFSLGSDHSHNAIKALLDKASSTNLDETKQALYELTSHWDNVRPGMTPDQWHHAILQTIQNDPHGIARLADPNTFSDVRDVYLHEHLAHTPVGGISTDNILEHHAATATAAHTLLPDTIASLGAGGRFDPAILGVGYAGAAGIAGGALAGRSAGIRAGGSGGGEGSSTAGMKVETLQFDTAYFEKRGIPLPKEKQVWELQPGAVDRFFHQKFYGKLKSSERFEVVITKVVGDMAYVELTTTPPKFKFTGSRHFQIPLKSMADRNTVTFIRDAEAAKATEAAKPVAPDKRQESKDKCDALIHSGTLFECKPAVATIDGDGTPATPLQIADMVGADGLRVHTILHLTPTWPGAPGTAPPSGSAAALLLKYRNDQTTPLKMIATSKSLKGGVYGVVVQLLP